MNKLPLMISFIVCLMINTGQSQSNFQPGYLINLAGDTVNGLIDNRYWEIHPVQISFRLDDSEEIERFVPVQVRGFGVGDFIFRSHQITYDDSPYKVNELSQSPQANMIEVHAFVQVLFDGNKSLYYHKDVKGKEVFFVGGEEGLEWLHYRRFMNVNRPGARNTGFFIENVERYKGQLLAYLEDCPAVRSNIEKAKYDKPGLSKVFKYYYSNCEGIAQYTFTDDGMRTRIHIGVFAGISISKINFEGTVLPWFVNTDYPASLNPTVGAGLELQFPRDNYSHSFVVDLHYSTMKFEGTYQSYSFGDFETYQHSSINLAYNNIRGLYQYNINLDKMTVYANAGLSVGLMMFAENHVVTEKFEYGVSASKEKGRAFRLRTLDPGIVAGLGLRYNRLSVRSTFEISKGPSLINGMSSITKKYYFTLGYTLTKSEHR
jgi:hypothetical protein